MDPSEDNQLERRWCAVTGGRGFMARHLVMALLRSRGWRVRITDLGPDAGLEPTENDGLLGAALRNGRAVYVCANACKLAQLMEGTKNVIQACHTCKVKTLIYTSSSSVVFDGVHELFGVDESTPYPDKYHDAYPETKAEAEKLVMRADGIDVLRTCCIRPATIFGPGGRIVPLLASYKGMMTTDAMDMLNEEVPVEVHGKKYLSVKYTNMADQVEATIAELEELLHDEPDKIVGMDVEYTSPNDGPKQKAAVIQLCADYRFLVFHIRHADRHCQVLTDFLANPAYTFAGVGIGNDKDRLWKVHLEVKNFVDIQTRWRVPYKEGTNPDGLAAYAASIIDSSYSRRMKADFTWRDHYRWEDSPLSWKHLKYAAMDAFATFETFRRLNVYRRGMERLNMINQLSVKGSSSKRRMNTGN